MAAKFTMTTTEKPVRTDAYGISPNDISFSRNGRGDHAKVDPATVKVLAVSIFHEGQKVPVTAHRGEEKAVIVHGGRNRVEAVRLIRQGFEHNGETIHNPQAMVYCVFDETVTTPEAAFRASILENLRTGVTDSQEAEAHHILRTEFSYTDKAICDLYGYTNNNRVKRLKDFYNAPTEIKKLQEKGSISLDTAITIASIEDEEVRKLEITRAKDGKVTTREVLDRIAEREEATGTEEGEKATKAKPGSQLSDGSAPTPTVTRPRNAANFSKMIDEKSDRFTTDQIVILEAVEKWLSGRAATEMGILNAFNKYTLTAKS